MSFPDLTAAERALVEKLHDGFPSLKVNSMPGNLEKWIKTKMKSTRGVALVQFVAFQRRTIGEAAEGWVLTYEVTILNKQLTASGHQGVHGYLEQSISALHGDCTEISSVDYTFQVDKGGFTGIIDQLWEYAFTVQMVPSLTI